MEELKRADSIKVTHEACKRASQIPISSICVCFVQTYKHMWASIAPKESTHSSLAVFLGLDDLMIGVLVLSPCHPFWSSQLGQIGMNSPRNPMVFTEAPKERSAKTPMFERKGGGKVRSSLLALFLCWVSFGFMNMQATCFLSFP